jgi:DNA-binding IclR family transcriptional regulator
MTGSDNHYIELISKTVAIIEALRDRPEGLSLQEVSLQTGQVKSSVHRILRSLAHHGYIEQSARRGRYRLGIQFLPVANSVRIGSNLVEIARPHSRKLSDQFDESTYIAVLRGGHGVFVDLQETSRDLRMLGPLGAQVHFHATAAGKVMAAFFPTEGRRAVLKYLHDAAITERTLVAPKQIEQTWDEVRRLGYAINNEETIIGAVFLAAPVFDSADVVCGSVSIGLPKSRYTGHVRKGMADGLRQCCRRISADLKAAACFHESAFDETQRGRKQQK